MPIEDRPVIVREKTKVEQERENLQLRKVAWKRIHADIFRAPVLRLAFCVLLGAGSQVILMAISTLGRALLLGTEDLVNFYLIIFPYFGYINGYIAAKFYKYFKGSNWKWLGLCSATFYPLLLFSSLTLMNSLDEVTTKHIIGE